MSILRTPTDSGDPIASSVVDTSVSGRPHAPPTTPPLTSDISAVIQTSIFWSADPVIRFAQVETQFSCLRNNQSLIILWLL